jgi:zinc/manganese transport system substrate-binding protein
MKLNRISFLILGAALAGFLPRAEAKLNVVATTPDLAAIAREVGGDQAKVTSLAMGTEDPHFVDAKPSFIRVLNQAEVLIEGGAELEVGWLPTLVNNARNAKILGNAPGHVIASQGVRLLEMPTSPVDRSQGDVHPLGNPHYLLAPDNCRVVAESLARTFSQLDAANAAVYQANLNKFKDRLAAKSQEWEKLLRPFRGTKIVMYHKSWDYFTAYFGLEVTGEIEPKPGIEPTPSHINALVPRAKAAGVKLVIMETFRSRRTPEQVARAIGAKLLALPLMPGGSDTGRDYFGWYDSLVAQVASALKP